MVPREDLPALRSLGFTDAELIELNLWEVAVGRPEDLADAYVRRSKKSDDLRTLRDHVRDMVRASRASGKRIRHVWFEQRSASKAHVRREEFEKACKAMLDGLSKSLMVWKTDRLSRRGMGQVGLLLDELDRRMAEVVSVTEGISSRTARMVFAILAERAREEAKDIALRTQAGVNAHKADGDWPGGVTPFGLMSVTGSKKLSHDPKEYPTARRIAAMLLAATTPGEIAEKLNSEEITTRHGKKWRAQTILNLANSPSWAGCIPNRERQKDEFGGNLDKYHRGGDPLFDKNGHPISCGEGVVTFAEREKILAIIANRTSGISQKRPGTSFGDKRRGIRAAATIATGWLRCPRCSGPMGNGGRNYRCNARFFQGPSVCVGIATSRERLDDALGPMWSAHIMSLAPESDTIQDIARRFLAYRDPAKETRKAAVLAALDKAASRELRLQKEFFIGGMDETLYDTLRVEVASQLESLKAEVKELSQEADLTPLMDPEALASLWETAGVEGQRALLSAAAKGATLTLPRHRGDRTPISERLVVDWRDSEKRPEAGSDWEKSLARSRRLRQAAEAAEGAL